ncbi:MAG: 16S rRNA (adenine(1518)-N(6)/adenine(1519)-N(6))-dimethyltransferase RsmA [Acidimicrobiia bacterium]
MTWSRRAATELLAAHGISLSRALGQNFVVDPNTVRRIARLAGVGEGDNVVEIGAGIGSLTLALAETGASVTAIEIDRFIGPILQEVVAPLGVQVILDDARAVDWSALLGDRTWSLVANLPYNIATPLVLDLLQDVPRIEHMLVMVQREVGERLAASAGDDAYGAVSVKVAYYATAVVVGKVPPTVFLPQPKVESALVRVTRRASLPDVDRERMFELINAGFGQRRKMLRRSLSTVVDARVFERASIRPEARAEELSLDEWVALTNSLQA